MEVEHLVAALSGFWFPSWGICENNKILRVLWNRNLRGCFSGSPFIENCFSLMRKDGDFLALLDGEDGKDSIRLSFLPLDSCRWSHYPFNFPFQSSLGNFLGKLCEVGSSVFLSVSEVLIRINHYFKNDFMTTQ